MTAPIHSGLLHITLKRVFLSVSLIIRYTKILEKLLIYLFFDESGQRLVQIDNIQ
ncbi:hypothetical protein DES35_101697 [Schleiferia thermophila]|jgi:hypothetical protein|uniref:Uncharacterized protein n=1 Tax=Schleiferia thermophila TaxID=884107 RepID=A0A369A7S4_9FLAO|nr:hypothetical protein DES35_101697 [Schleiferia thermophila]